jgi:hypothetical protein
MVKLNITTCTGVSLNVTTNQTYQVIKMTYYSTTNEAILTGLSISTTPYNYAIYAFNLESNSITFWKNYSSSYSWLSYNYEKYNNKYFCLNHFSLFAFNNFVNECSNGLIYDYSTYQCVQNITTSPVNTTQPAFNTTNTTNLTNNINTNHSINANNTINSSNTV